MPEAMPLMLNSGEAPLLPDAPSVTSAPVVDDQAAAGKGVEQAARRDLPDDRAVVVEHLNAHAVRVLVDLEVQVDLVSGELLDHPRSRVVLVPERWRRLAGHELQRRRWPARPSECDAVYTADWRDSVVRHWLPSDPSVDLSV
jgi:hypothetical protein